MRRISVSNLASTSEQTEICDLKASGEDGPRCWCTRFGPLSQDRVFVSDHGLLARKNIQQAYSNCYECTRITENLCELLRNTVTMINSLLAVVNSGRLLPFTGKLN